MFFHNVSYFIIFNYKSLHQIDKNTNHWHILLNSFIVHIVGFIICTKCIQDESSTIYKTVDFEMTKAFNQIRKDVKEEKRQVVTRDHRIWQDPQGVLDKTLVSSRVS